MRWTTRMRNLTILAGVAAAAAVAIALAGRAKPVGVRAALVNAAPRDAFLVATIDVQALRASPLADAILGSAGAPSRALPGVSELSAACGFDPLAKVKEIVVAIPENGEPGEFGLAASGDVDAEQFEACAKKAIEMRGGRAKSQRKGAYTLVEDEAAAGAKTPRVALRDGGVVLVGRGAWLQSMMDAADGVAPSVEKNEQHMELRGELAKAKRVVLVTALLPKALRDRLKRDMGAELDSEDRAKLEMGGVLAVQSAGLALSIDDSSDDKYGETQARAELRCESAAACKDVKELIERKRLQASQDLGIRLVGLGPVLDALSVTTEGSGLTATTHAPTAELGKALERAFRFQGRRAKAVNSAAAQDAGRPPDEVLGPRPDASAR